MTEPHNTINHLLSQHSHASLPQHAHQSPASQHVQHSPGNHMPPPGHDMNNMSPHHPDAYHNAAPIASNPIPHNNNDMSADGAPNGGDLGPLPPNWEQAFTEKGEPYFIE